jgi:hypothetical protein
MTIKPSIDELIDQVAKLPPGPAPWAPIFEHYPALAVEELEQKFRQSAERDFKEAEQSRRLARLL